MKALLISDDENFVTNCTFLLENNNYDIITYKWLLKAIDNIEEIKPDLIILSSSEYPRHWKTLVQFVKSGIGGDEVKIYLYEPTPISSDDTEKAKVLGITGTFTSVDELKSIFDGEEIIQEEDDEVPQVSDIVENNKPLVGHIIFTNPETNCFNTGKVIAISDTTITCELDFELNLKIATELSKVTYIWNNEVKKLSACIDSCSNKDLTLSVIKYYEEI